MRFYMRYAKCGMQAGRAEFERLLDGSVLRPFTLPSVDWRVEISRNFCSLNICEAAFLFQSDTFYQ